MIAYSDRSGERHPDYNSSLLLRAETAAGDYKSSADVEKLRECIARAKQQHQWMVQRYQQQESREMVQRRQQREDERERRDNGEGSSQD